MNKSLQLPSINDLHRMKNTHQRITFYDTNQRELMVDLRIVCRIKYHLKIVISVPYVILNKSGIPLVLKDVNSKTEAAGQNEESELAINREALLFAFDNSNRNNTCVMRVGTGLHKDKDGRPQWSQRFSFEHGSIYRQLQVRSSRNSHLNYSIGIDIHSGSGLLKTTKFIFLSARYMICNQCSYDLIISQRSLIDDETKYLRLSKHATATYHWPRTDMEQFLCVKIIDNNQWQIVNWSGGFQIDSINAFHINMRYSNGQCFILRVQIIERSSTYFVVFMDSDEIPAPFRISNLSNIPIKFHQSEIRSNFTYLNTIIEPHQSIDYALDEPTLKSTITCSITDSSKTIYDLLKLGPAEDLKYENYIYIAFQTTFHDKNDDNKFNDFSKPLIIESDGKRVFVAKRQDNKRSQLWQIRNNGQLINVGLSFSDELNKKKENVDDIRQAFVLDIEDLVDSSLTNLKTRLTSLAVRRFDPKRALTQTWQFVDNGYLCLANTQICVQVFGELIENSDIVLGSITNNINELPDPTMHIRPHQLFKGSSVLFARIIADGPTNILEFDQIKITDPLIPITDVSSTNFHLDLSFPTGIGISLVGSTGHESEELMYVFVNNLHIEYEDKNEQRSVEGTIGTLIISNQLLTTATPCFLYGTYSDESIVKSAIHIKTIWQKSNINYQSNILYIIHLVNIDVNSIAIQLDEMLLWKLIDFFDIDISSSTSSLLTAAHTGRSFTDESLIDLKINDYETERVLSLLTSTHATRIYFNKFYLSSTVLNLSIYCIQTKRSLSPHLLTIKRRAVFPLVPFENAQIHLKSFEQTHTLNTHDVFLLSIKKHYISTCTRQILKIIGTADFLGNPIGLIHDVSEGVNCLVHQGSVSGLVKNVTHGVANSTSKVTSSISSGLGKLVSDNQRDDRRQALKEGRQSTTFGNVFRQGTAGLAAGLYGGLTSMIKQPYKGVVEEGAPGLVKGLAKGIVGTVSKPMVGILDLTNDVAAAIKEGARSTNTILRTRVRPTRCASNILGLLQSYSNFDAEGHNLLYKMNKGNRTERYLTRIILSSVSISLTDKKISTTNTQRNKQLSDKNDTSLEAMITTQRVIIYRKDNQSDSFNFEIIESYEFDTSMTVVPIDDDHNYAYVQFLSNEKDSTFQKIHRCDTIEQATVLSREIQRAQILFEEDKMIYITSDDENEDIFNDLLDNSQTE